MGLIDGSINGSTLVSNIDWSIKLDDERYLSIMGNYYSDNEMENEQFKDELISVVESIKIKCR